MRSLQRERVYEVGMRSGSSPATCISSVEEAAAGAAAVVAAGREVKLAALPLEPLESLIAIGCCIGSRGAVLETDEGGAAVAATVVEAAAAVVDEE